MSATRELDTARALHDACVGLHHEAMPRAWLYRELVQNNVRGVLRQLIPRATALMDEHAKGSVEALVDDFLRGPGMRSHYMREIPYEIFAWGKERLAGDARLPPYTVTLAAWELFWFRVRIAERTPRPDQLVDAAPHLPLVLESPALLETFACNIHAWEDDTPPPEPAETILLGYRDEKEEPKLFVLTPLAAAIVRELQKGSALAHAIPNACKTLGLDLSQSVLNDSARLLADLSNAGIILGAQQT